ncbi:RING-H2 finger protein ATL66-like [Cornus florida]|uniref:RING-H2 finger protein ATL66-like n=1 Tax=Cornus florida TaxID=4283 RepID=UPI0028978B50|nr:RING-H2 finger protein ATL66-like [Cornus florida]
MAFTDFEPFHWHLTDLYYTFHFHIQSILLLVIFFCFVILFPSLYIYYHFFFRHISSANTATALSPVSLAIAIRSQSDGLDAATIHSFPICLHKDLATKTCNMMATNTTTTTVKNVVEDMAAECSICLGVFQDEEMVKVLPECHHTYHCVCVDKWLTTQSSCPLCRASLHAVSSTEPAVVIDIC